MSAPGRAQLRAIMSMSSLSPTSREAGGWLQTMSLTWVPIPPSPPPSKLTHTELPGHGWEDRRQGAGPGRETWVSLRNAGGEAGGLQKSVRSTGASQEGVQPWGPEGEL